MIILSLLFIPWSIFGIAVHTQDPNWRRKYKGVVALWTLSLFVNALSVLIWIWIEANS